MSITPDASVRAMRKLDHDIKAALARGDLPPAAIADLKRTIDELRMRLWASMEAAKSGDPTWVQEFWLNRAADLCKTVIGHLERGELDRRLGPAGELRTVAQRLAASLTAEPG